MSHPTECYHRLESFTFYGRFVRVELRKELHCEHLAGTHRLTAYDVRISQAILSVHRKSIDYQFRVCTSLVEPFEARIGSEYMVLGEMETTSGNIPVIQARLLMEADGVNLPLLERAVQEQRKYFQQRDGRGTLETEVANKRDV
ncbi:CST complex subunit TEN1 isoform X4 [Heterodontus francisci]|uniref:CST complex subunit TEN1 isoform X4 n=1 Tax=Heterodontus francisci TaxID=7792 RepID=UPI00355C5503